MTLLGTLTIQILRMFRSIFIQNGLREIATIFGKTHWQVFTAIFNLAYVLKQVFVSVEG